VSGLVGFDQIVGFMITLCSYIGTEMEKEQTVQQMMELLLARMDAWGKEMDSEMRAIQAKTKVHQEDLQNKMNANMKATQERMDANLRI
jgi:hypothetical protein